MIIVITSTLFSSRLHSWEDAHSWASTTYDIFSVLMSDDLWTNTLTHFAVRLSSHSSRIKLAITTSKFTRFKGEKKKKKKKREEHFCISHGWLRHHLHICSQLSRRFSFFLSKNKGRLFRSFRVRACRHSTCRNHAGLCWALNWKMLAASLQFWTVESAGSQTFSWHRTLDRHRLHHRLCCH